MTGMVAGWIVSVTLCIVCGCIAFVLARIVNGLDRMSTMPDASEPNLPAPEPAANEMAASAARADAVEDPLRCKP